MLLSHVWPVPDWWLLSGLLSGYDKVSQHIVDTIPGPHCLLFFNTRALSGGALGVFARTTSHEKQGVVTYIPAVLTPATGIKI